MSITNKIKNLCKIRKDYLSYEEYKDLMNIREHINFMSKTTDQSISNLLSKQQ